MAEMGGIGPPFDSKRDWIITGLILVTGIVLGLVAALIVGWLA